MIQIEIENKVHFIFIQFITNHSENLNIVKNRLYILRILKTNFFNNSLTGSDKLTHHWRFEKSLMFKLTLWTEEVRSDVD